MWTGGAAFKLDHGGTPKCSTNHLDLPARRPSATTGPPRLPDSTPWTAFASGIHAAVEEAPARGRGEFGLAQAPGVRSGRVGALSSPFRRSPVMEKTEDNQGDGLGVRP